MSEVNLFTGEGTSLTDEPTTQPTDTVEINGQQMTPIGKIPKSKIEGFNTDNMEPIGKVNFDQIDPISLVKNDPDGAVKSYRARNPEGITFGDVITAGPKLMYGMAKGALSSLPPLVTGGAKLANRLSTNIGLGSIGGDEPTPEEKQKADAELTGAWLDTRESLKNQYEGLKFNKSKMLGLFSNLTGGRVGEKLSDNDIKSYLLSQAHQHDIASKVQSGDIKGALTQMSDEGGTWFTQAKKGMTPDALKQAAAETPSPEELQKAGYSGEDAAKIGQAGELALWSTLPLGKVIPSAITEPLASAGLSAGSKILSGAASIFDNPIMRRGLHYSPAYATFSAITGHPHGMAALGLYAARPIGQALRGAADVVGEAAMKPDEALFTGLMNKELGAPTPSLASRATVGGLRAGAEGAAQIAPFALSAQSPEEAGEVLGTGAMFGAAGLGARQGMLDAVFRLKGGAPLNLSTKPFETGHPDDANHAEAIKDFPQDLKDDINRARHGYQGLGHLFVLPENVFNSRFQEGAQGVHNGNIYLNGELGARMALAHEPMHGIMQAMPQAARQDIFDSLLKFNNPSAFATKYFSDLYGEPTVVDFDSLPEKSAGAGVDPANPNRITKQWVLEEMAVDAMRNKGFNDLTQNPDVLRWLQLGAGKMAEKLGLPMTDNETKGIYGINPSYRAVSIMEQALRNKGVSAVRQGPTYGQEIADPSMHYETVKNALRATGYNAGEAGDKTDEAIDDAKKLGRSVSEEDLIKRALTGRFPAVQQPAPKPAAPPAQPAVPPPVPPELLTPEQKARVNELVAEGHPEDVAFKMANDEFRNIQYKPASGYDKWVKQREKQLGMSIEDAHKLGYDSRGMFIAGRQEAPREKVMENDPRKGVYGWMDDSGKFVPNLEDNIHWETAVDALGLEPVNYTPEEGQEVRSMSNIYHDAFAKGWLRLTKDDFPDGRALVAHYPMSYGDIEPSRMRELTNIAKDNNYVAVIRDGEGEASYTPLWIDPKFKEESQNYFMPKISAEMYPEGKAPTQERMDEYNRFPDRIGAAGTWDRSKADPNFGNVPFEDLADQLGADKSKRFYEQKPEIQQKIKDYFMGQGEAQYMPKSPPQTEEFKKWTEGAPVVMNAGRTRINKLPDITIAEGDGKFVGTYTIKNNDNQFLKEINNKGMQFSDMSDSVPRFTNLQDAQMAFRAALQHPAYAETNSGKSFETGRPVIVAAYHGSGAKEFYTFDKTKLGSNTGAPSAKEGFFFAGNKQTADSYKRANRYVPQIISAQYATPWIDAEYPFRYNVLDTYKNKIVAKNVDQNTAHAWAAKNMDEGTMHEVFVKFKNPLVRDFEGQPWKDGAYMEAIGQAKKDGHDGVIFKATRDGGGHPDNVFVAFEGNQIKSAKNTGTFDAGNPDIRYMPQPKDPRAYIMRVPLHEHDLLGEERGDTVLSPASRAMDRRAGNYRNQSNQFLQPRDTGQTNVTFLNPKIVLADQYGPRGQDIPPYALKDAVLDAMTEGHDGLVVLDRKALEPPNADKEGLGGLTNVIYHNDPQVALDWASKNADVIDWEHPKNIYIPLEQSKLRPDTVQEAAQEPNPLTRPRTFEQQLQDTAELDSTQGGDWWKKEGGKPFRDQDGYYMPPPREVSPEELQNLKDMGRNMLESMRSGTGRSMEGMARDWNNVLNRAYASVQRPWGGMTINPETGRDIRLSTSSGQRREGPFALSVKDEGQNTIEIPADAPQTVFNKAMSDAIKAFPQLTGRDHYLGVFRDEDKGTIDFDPVAIVDTKQQAEALGAYTNAIGGAYDYATGDGVPPPIATQPLYSPMHKLRDAVNNDINDIYDFVPSNDLLDALAGNSYSKLKDAVNKEIDDNEAFIPSNDTLDALVHESQSNTDNIQYMPRNDAEVAKFIDKETGEHPEAIIPAFKRQKDGTLTLDPKTKQAIPVDMRYNLDETPMAKQVMATAEPSKARDAMTSAYANKLVDFFHSVKSNPEIMKGMGWYKLTNDKLRSLFGDDTGLFAQLLAATSPNTEVSQNFNYALDAYNQFKSGAFDDMLNRFADAWIDYQNGDLKTKDGQVVEGDKAFTNYLNSHGLVPHQSNGKRIGMHSIPVLYTLAGGFLEKMQGLKVRQFAANLAQTDLNATIDMWAARTLHRLGNEGSLDRWRILPANETGINPNDFGIGQESFGKAAKQLKMNPDDLQAVLWFAEKELYDFNGWSRVKQMGDFRGPLSKLKPNPSGAGYLKDVTMP